MFLHSFLCFFLRLTVTLHFPLTINADVRSVQHARSDDNQLRVEQQQLAAGGKEGELPMFTLLSSPVLCCDCCICTSPSLAVEALAFSLLPPPILPHQLSCESSVVAR
jgi:hypothetical protein